MSMKTIGTWLKALGGISVFLTLGYLFYAGGADPFREFLERYFGESLPREEPRQSLGSGVIVESEGYVLTNNQHRH